MTTYTPTRTAASRLRARIATACVITMASLFAVVPVLLTWAHQGYLRQYGWRFTDHAGVPWPSSLATGPHGWLQITAFALLGSALVVLAAALRPALPPRPAARITCAALAAQGLGLAAAAFPLDNPVGDPSVLSSWTRSWHAYLHVAGFLLAGAAAIVATAALARAFHGAERWRGVGTASAMCSAVLVVTFVVSTAPAWYAFLVVDLAWIVAVAGWLRRTVRGGA